MSIVERIHHEDIKAAIRKRFRSLAAFERAEGLARQSVSEVLRGRPSRRTETAIERVLREHRGEVESITAVSSDEVGKPHRLNAVAR